MMKLYPNLPESEPDCIYDSPEAISEGLKAKISRLEEEIAQLEATIMVKDAQLAACVCRFSGSASSQAPTSVSTRVDSYTTLSNEDSASGSISPLDPMARRQPLANILPLEPFNEKQAVEAISPPKNWQQIPPLLSAGSEPHALPTDLNGTAESALSLEIWPLNIPPRELLHHLVETVFHSVPLASRAIHRASFMKSLQQPPSSNDFPHVTLLHAFCALASLYTPIVVDMNPVSLSEQRDVGAAATVSGGVVNHGFRWYRQRFFPRRLEDIIAEEEHDFASSHIKWCHSSFHAALQRGDALLQQLQATCLCVLFFHSRGKFVSTLTWLKNASTLLPSTGLHQAPGFGPLSRIPSELHYTMPPAQSPIETETRCNVFWVIFTMHRVINSTNVLPLVTPDADCSQMMPCRLGDFEAGFYVPAQGRQRLFSHKMLITHPRLTTDAFTLYIKATVLLGRVKTFNVRFRYKYTDGDGTDHHPATMVSSPASGAGFEPPPKDYGRLVNEVTTINPLDTEEFSALDDLIESFIENIPGEFRDPVGLNTGAKLDPILYMAHLVPHMAMITLHDPHANVFAAHDASAEKLLKSARTILDLIYKVCSTTFDLIYLDHSASTAWFFAGVTLIRFLNARTIQKNDAEVARLNQELGVIKFILGNLGDRTAVGFRHIKLLEMVYAMEMGSHPLPGDQSVMRHSASVNEVSI
ncbi:hypothetical protein FRB95_003580 [Tulasnella sp. JGI-2019a]|nr:hypothetical protein FRB93_000407 [Tulasnella sp. JGI-2019a]KAG9030734.1 hypothetical protein FRB95_003580 [Tulasnella sp. JGI-2019a]